MTFWLAAAHAYAALCAFGIAAVLKGAALSPEFRLRIGPTERDRSYNFSLVSLFLFALCLDLGAVPFDIHGAPHIAAVTLACLTGTLALSLFGLRLLLWKT